MKLAGLALLFAAGATAQTGAVRLLVSNGLKAVVVQLQPEAERAAGHPLAMQFGTTASIEKQIEAGEPFDAALITADAIDKLAKEGKIASDTRADLARSGIGVGIRAGAPKPYIATPDAVKQMLLKAKSITFAGNGASRPHLDKMFEQLGIAADVKPKIALEQGSARAAARVAGGQSDVLLTLVSEILPAPGVELVGPLPAALQSYVNFKAGVSAHAQHPDAAKALIRFMTAPAAGAVYKAKGMEPR